MRPVIIMAGGTGGHIFPGLVVAGELQEAGVPVVWFGTGGLENRWLSQLNIPLDVIPIAGVRGKGLLTWLAAPVRVARALLRALRLLRRRRPRAVLSMGGFVAGPGGLAAWLLRVPLIVQEQNRIPGATNRILGRLARTVCEGFPGAFPERVGAVHTGNPVRPSLTRLPDPDARFADRGGTGRLLVLGGSLGARALNTTLPAALATLDSRRRPEVLHQSGERHLDAARTAYARAGIDARVVSFIEAMDEAYAWADLVVCRAGGLTLAELAVVGLGAILVPFPHAVEDHQTANARYLADAGAAQLIPESDLSVEDLAQRLGDLFVQRPRLLDMARAARRLGRPDAGARVAQLCLEVAR